jgi:hypothetical protein
MSKATSEITRRFVNVWVRTQGTDTAELEKAFFVMGFRWQGSKRGEPRELRTQERPSYIRTEDNYSLYWASCPGARPEDYGYDAKEVSRDEVLAAAEEVRKIKRAESKASKKRRAQRRWDATATKRTTEVCPVRENVVIAVKLNNGTVVTKRSGWFDWATRHLDQRGSNIASYKVLVPNKHKPEPVESSVVPLESMVQAVAWDLGKGVATPVHDAVLDTDGSVVATGEFVKPALDTTGPLGTNPKKQYGVQSIPLSCWSSLASAYGSLAFYNGALKYGKANYANTPVEASIYIDGAMRHLAAWAAGEEFDPADGVPNLGGVLANIAILLEARAANMLIDDRAKQSGYLKERDELKKIVKHLNELHAGKNPKHYTLEKKE